MDKLTHNNEQSRPKKKVKLLFQVHPRGKVFTHDQQTCKNAQQDFLDPFCPRASPSNIVSAQVSGNFFSSCHSKPDRNKHAYPKLLPRQLKVRQKSAAVQRSPSQGVYNLRAEHVTVWEDKTCLYASRSGALLFFFFFYKHQRPHGGVADKKEVKLLKN